jgi:hypothetical protein
VGSPLREEMTLLYTSEATLQKGVRSLYIW